MKRWTRMPLTLAVLGTLALVGCDDDDDPVGPDPYHGEDIASIELVLQDVVIATYDVASQSWDFGLELDDGFETEFIQVDFLDEFGFSVDLDLDFYLEVEIDDELVLVFEQDVLGEFGGYFIGVDPGFADVTFSLIHDPSDQSEHADLVTDELEVQVTP